MRAMETAGVMAGAVASAAAWLATYGATFGSAGAALFAAGLAAAEMRKEEARPMLVSVFCINGTLGVFGAPVVVDYFELDHAGAVIVAAFVIGLMGHNALVAGLRALGARLGGQRK